MIAVLLALWDFLQWVSLHAYDSGFDRGRDLLASLNDGRSTSETLETIVKREASRVEDKISKMNSAIKRTI